ncbi:MAG TPA: hypothetical protein VFJ47_10355, partial [Terriglobales bacterium]|nr:hypothetical protein [Terriglobales bacterium]
MAEFFHSPEQTTYSLFWLRILFTFIPAIGVVCFAYIVVRRMTPLLRGERDFRSDRPLLRLERVLKFWLAQWKHPRYKGAGTLHILVFTCFLILAPRAFYLLIVGISDKFVITHFPAQLAGAYDLTRQYAATLVFLCMVIFAVRRLVFKPARYAVP